MPKFPFRRPSLEELDKKLVFSLARTRIPRLRQLKLLPAVVSNAERWVLRVAASVLILTLTVMLTRFVTRHTTALPRAGGSYREALVGTPRLINPVLATSDVDRDLVRLIYGSLLVYNGKGELEGDLAQQFVLEDDGRTIRFTLREGLRWHDGEVMNGSDAVFTIEAIKNTAWRSPLWRSFQDVTVESPDPKTVVVKSNAFSVGFPHLFTVGILPKHIWEHVDPQGARLAVWNIKPVGGGPYQFKSLTKSRDGTLSAYRLTRFVNYHSGAPYIKEIVLSFFPDFESAISELREHTVDGVSFVPERLRARVPAAGFQLFRPYFPRFTAIFFQDRKSEVLRDRAVRAALASALDRGAIAALVADAVPGVSVFLEGQVGYTKFPPVPSGDLERARAILTEGGWRKEETGWIKNKKKLAFTLTLLDEPSYLLVADEVKRAWGELGVDVKVEAAPRVGFEQDVLRARFFEALLFSVVSGADPDPYPFWHSSQIDDPGLALSSVHGRAMDAALEGGRATAEVTSRFRSYLEFRQSFDKEVPAIILYVSPYGYAISKKVRGVALERMTVPADRWSGVGKWFVRSRPSWR